MTKQEFEKKTGLKINDANFEFLNEVYMVDNNMDKDVFCEIFKDMGPIGRELMFKIGAYITKQQGCINALKEKNGVLNKQITRMAGEKNENETEAAHMLIHESAQTDNIEARNLAAKLISMRELIVYKVLNNIELWADEADYMRSNLK